MIDTDVIYQKLIAALDNNQVEYKLFTHKPIFSYEDAKEAQKETGFIGTEGKCLVLKADEDFIVYNTLQGKKADFEKIKNITGKSKIRLATPEELKENFGAQPGCAYPFGFDSKFDIYIDPEIYDQEWLLFSPVFPNKTIQAKGKDLKRVFDSLENKVIEIS